MLAWTGVVALAVLIPIVARVAWEGRAELELAARAHEVEDLEKEVEHLGRAARWRLPGADHDEEALARLEQIGEEREEAEDTLHALLAYRELRHALLATRAGGVPHEPMFHATNEKIARLMAAQETELEMARSDDGYAYHLALLEEVPGPDPLRANLAAWSFVAWLGATGGFLWRSIDGEGGLRPRQAVRWGFSSCALLVIWMVLLRLA